MLSVVAICCQLKTEKTVNGAFHSPSLSQSKSNKTNYFTENNNHHINSHSMSINSLEIADGLKELLIKYGFTLEELLTTPTSDLAEYLGIDLYIAKIICTAARKSSSCSNSI
jgi:hypothetical protein